MTSQATDRTTNAEQPKASAGQHTNAQSERELRIGRELADTTWRIAVPVLLFAGAGLFADRRLNIGPWLTLTGMVIGFIVAGILVKRQLARWPAAAVMPGSYERNRQPGDEEHGYYDDDDRDGRAS